MPFGHPYGYSTGRRLYTFTKWQTQAPGWQSHNCFASNSDKLLQAPTISIIYMTFLKTRSGDFVGTPPRVNIFRGGGAQDRKQIRFQTYRHPDFQFYDKIFYLDYKYKTTKAGEARSASKYWGIIDCKSRRLLVH